MPRGLWSLLSLLGGAPPDDLSPTTVRRLARVFAVVCILATGLFVVALLNYYLT
jgi:hypothetical protein